MRKKYAPEKYIRRFRILSNPITVEWHESRSLQRKTVTSRKTEYYFPEDWQSHKKKESGKLSEVTEEIWCILTTRKVYPTSKFPFLIFVQEDCFFFFPHFIPVFKKPSFLSLNGDQRIIPMIKKLEFFFLLFSCRFVSSGRKIAIQTNIAWFLSSVRFQVS